MGKSAVEETEEKDVTQQGVPFHLTTLTSYDFIPEISGEDEERNELDAEILAALGESKLLI